MQNLPDKLYNVDSIVRLEQIAINQFGIPAYTLMKSAGEAVFNVKMYWFYAVQEIMPVMAMLLPDLPGKLVLM